MKIKHKRVLMLNYDYTCLGIVGWKRAVTLSIINQCEPEQGVIPVEYYHNDFIMSAGGRKFLIPAVVRAATYIRQIRKHLPFSRKNVFIRDQLCCQYCGKQFEPDKLTYDHVIPRAIWKKKKYKGTPTNYTNIVTACFPCNSRKGDKSLKDSGMKLLREPKIPSAHAYIPGLSPWSKIPKIWAIYLPPLYTKVFEHD